MLWTLVFSIVFLAFVSGTITPKCPAGTIPKAHDDQWCYLFVNQSASFDDADYFCKSKDGFLTEINDQFTNTFMAYNGKTNFGSGAFWIGAKLYKSGSCSIWVWIRENSIISFFDWSQPDAGTSGSGDRISVNTDEGTWTRQNKSTKLPYVCQIFRVSVCESGWTHFDLTGKCYKVFAQKNVTHPVAEEFCVDHGGHLASIHSSEENDLIGQLTSTMYVGRWYDVGVHIGFVADSSYKWSWTDNSPVDYLHWGSVDPVANRHSTVFCPDGTESIPAYVRMWNAFPDGYGVSRYICKKDASVVQISN